MQLRHLQTLVAIAEEQTLTAAANRLFKTQGAVSHDLKALETEFGVMLVDRSGQRATLTPAGEELLRHAYELLQRVDDIEGEMKLMRSGELGSVRVGVIPSLSVRMAAIVAEFLAANPGVRFRLYSELRGSLDDWLVKGRIDMILGDSTLEAEQLEITSLGYEPLVIVVAPDDALVGQEEIRPPMLEGKPFIGYDRELDSPQTAERFFATTGRYPEPLVRTNDHRLMKRFVRSGLGYALMPASTIEPGDDLVTIPTDPPIERRIALLQRADRRSPQLLHAFHDFVVQRWATERLI